MDSLDFRINSGPSGRFHIVLKNSAIFRQYTCALLQPGQLIALHALSGVCEVHALRLQYCSKNE